MLETISQLSKFYHRCPEQSDSSTKGFISIKLFALILKVEKIIGDTLARNRIESFLEMIGGNIRVTG